MPSILLLAPRWTPRPRLRAPGRSAPVALTPAAPVPSPALRAAVLLAACIAGAGDARATEPGAEPRALGAETFRLYCAECHGANGDGYGIRQDISYARPRSFQSARFKLATTENGVPSDDDLRRTIERGMPGSGMPNWSHLSEREIAAVAAHVRAIGVEALREALARQVAAGRRTPAEAERILAARTTPGPAVEVPPEPPVDEQGLRRGRAIYREACEACHGPRGATPFGLVTTDFDGNRLPPTSLEHGVFKGGDEGEQLYVRILQGMDGTAMPGYQGAYPPIDLWHVVHYVQSLSAPGGSPIDVAESDPAAPSAPATGSPMDPASKAAHEQPGTEGAGLPWLGLLVAAAALCLILLLVALGLGSAR